MRTAHLTQDHGFTADHLKVVNAAWAIRNDQPEYAATLLESCDDPLGVAVEMVGLLLAERAEALSR